MQKNLVQLEFKAAEKLYHFTCEPDSPIEHVKLALFDFLKYVGRVEDAIAAQQAQMPAATPPVTDEVKEAA